MEVKAQLNNLRIAPRKVRSLAGILRGADALRARSQLAYATRRSASPLAKLLDSALANAQNNFGLAKENMYIKQVIVNEGAKLKRFRPKGFGSTSPIEKKTSHITIVLAERVPGLKAEKKAKPTVIEPTEPEVKSEHKTSDKKPVYKTAGVEKKQPGMMGNLKRRLFRRKAI